MFKEDGSVVIPGWAFKQYSWAKYLHCEDQDNDPDLAHEALNYFITISCHTNEATNTWKYIKEEIKPAKPEKIEEYLKWLTDFGYLGCKPGYMAYLYIVNSYLYENDVNNDPVLNEPI